MSVIHAAIWETAAAVGTPVALGAFAVAAGLFAARARIAQRRCELESAKSDRRVELLAAMEGVLRLDESSLPDPARFELAKRILRDRERRFLAVARATVVLAALLTTVVVISMSTTSSSSPANARPAIVHRPQIDAEIHANGEAQQDIANVPVESGRVLIFSEPRIKGEIRASDRAVQRIGGVVEGPQSTH